MFTKLISVEDDEQHFITELNDVLEELNNSEKQIVDVKYQTSAYVLNMHDYVRYSALVIYKD